MKKFFILFIIFFGSFPISFAEDSKEATHTKIITPSEFPGVKCNQISKAGEKDESGNVKDDRYECSVPKSSNSLIQSFGGIIKYFAFLTGIFGVLFIVINGIMYSMGGLDQELKDTAKKRISQTLIGLILLFLSGYILQILAPWFFK